MFLAGRHAFRKQLLFPDKLHKVDTVEMDKLFLSRDDDR